MEKENIYNLIRSRQSAILVDMGNDVVKEFIDFLWPESDQIFDPPKSHKIKVLVAHEDDHKKWQYGDTLFLQKTKEIIPLIQLSELYEYKKIWGPNPPAGIIKL